MEIRSQLRTLEDDLNFIRVGNGVHNIHYATSLTRAVVESLAEICRELEIEEPKVSLPTEAELVE